MRNLPVDVLARRNGTRVHADYSATVDVSATIFRQRLAPITLSYCSATSTMKQFGRTERPPNHISISLAMSSYANSNLSKEELHALPGVCAKPDPATSSYVFQQTMFRIRDPKASLEFYTRALGMTLMDRLDFQDMSFSLYFLGFVDPDQIPVDRKERVQWIFSQPACLELTHNWGTETDPDFKGYHNGNSDPKGFGHIGISVEDVEAAAQRWESMGIEFVKKPADGKMQGIAFIKDPDGYWIEVLDAKKSTAFVDWPGNQQE